MCDGKEWFDVYCFSDPTDAEKFKQRFGGEKFNPIGGLNGITTKQLSPADNFTPTISFLWSNCLSCPLCDRDYPRGACPLSGAKRTRPLLVGVAANDPKRT